MAGYVGLKPCLSSLKSARSRLAYQPDGLPRTERVASALRFAPEDYEEFMRKGGFNSSVEQLGSVDYPFTVDFVDA